jgi:hypothetical protein
VLASFLRALGVEERAIPWEQEDRARLYRSLLSGKRALVLLDNARDESQVRPLVPGCSHCAVLVTSRRSLNALEGTTVALRLAMLTDQDALALLVRLIGDDRVSAELDAARRVVRLCGCLPLAVRIAGGRLRTGYELQQYASRLEDERGRLKQLRLSDLDVRSSFVVSHQNLSREEAHLFRLLGLFPGESFTSEAAAALLGDEGKDVWSLLDSLLDAQLLELVGGVRYGFHDLVRLFSRECLQDEELKEQKAARLRVATWYVGASRAMNDWLQPEKRLQKVAELAAQTRRSPEEVGRNEVVKALAWFETERANL